MSNVATTPVKHRSWTRDGFLISTDPSLIPVEELNQAFASDYMYWATALPEQVMRDMLDKSLCFAVYSPTPGPRAPNVTAAPDPAETLPEIAAGVKPPGQPNDSPATEDETAPGNQESYLIGFARGVTDRITMFYLTDVYILPSWQGQGLGKWLISCVQEVVEEMPHLRRTMAIVGHDKEQGMAFYKRLMKMEPMSGLATVLEWKGPGNVF